MRECAEQLSLVVLQIGVSKKWIWKLHSSHKYTVKSSYNHLTSSDVAIDDRCNHILWFKQIPLEVNIYIWRLFLNRLATKINLFIYWIIMILFVRLLADWLRISTICSFLVLFMVNYGFYYRDG